MKRFLLAAGSLVSLLFAGANQPPVSTSVAATSVDVTSSKDTTAKQQAQKAEMSVVQVRSRAEVGYAATHFRDLSGPRRVKYGNSRWITLS